ncbi:MAG: leucine-rich repeat domain-containing protein, partial [Clostridiales bacterium]|nr:leucine-rich repeat domain-containing protein [Clostridiales bacterium]
DYEPIRELLPNITDKDFEPLFGDAAPDAPIEIAEPAFEAALRRAMNIYDRPITERDAYLVRSLALHNEKTEESMFSDITPLKYFVNLEHLEFNSNPIADLSALAGLTRLKSLNVGFCSVGDLTPLSSLTNLNCLNLACCPVGDLTALSGLVNLDYLNLNNCPVTDFAPLANLTNLRMLDLTNVQIDDKSPLDGLRKDLQIIK